jgi:CRP-like cAMP-binding protein
MASSMAQSISDALGELSLFADLTRPQLEAVATQLEERSFDAGRRILHQGFEGEGFYVILDGRAAVRIDGREVSVLSRGDFFGEISLLLSDKPSADVVALEQLRCLTLAGHQLQEFLLSYPPLMFRMLQSQARRLRATSAWRS